MNVRQVTAIAVAALSLAACGTASEAESRSAASPLPTTAAPTDDLATVHERCAGTETILSFVDSYDQVGRIYVGGLKQVAAKFHKTEEGVMRGLLAETYDSAEDTLTIDGAFADDHDHGMTEKAVLLGIYYQCVLRELAVPVRVRDHIGTTRALDGQQTDTWDDINARWTYHPENGVSITFWEA